jgi:hypothetical protein
MPHADLVSDRLQKNGDRYQVLVQAVSPGDVSRRLLRSLKSWPAFVPVTSKISRSPLSQIADTAEGSSRIMAGLLAAVRQSRWS